MWHQQQQHQQQSCTIPFSQRQLDHAQYILQQIHTPDLVTELQSKCDQSRQRRIEQGKQDPLGFIGCNIDDDTYVTTETYDVCLRATATWIQGVDYILDTQQQQQQQPPVAMALTRPPGHHATRSTSSNGFCIFNFAAAATHHYLQQQQQQQQNTLSSSSSNSNPFFGRGRVAILDWDVHYGQGIADIIQTVSPSSPPPSSTKRTICLPSIRYRHFCIKVRNRKITNNKRYSTLTIPIPAETTSWTCGYRDINSKFCTRLFFCLGSK
ncbi:histone deacetylase superfamily protein [Nitzschia inconspicua]|uniref:Histone deacetylase superfamily protein n=1 Tax=Nitzschia inconspicua TaxID=303405 RepID=A0A9K3PL71_9STRA|nr:histone deacetylase superfamily protein [Nitzschia inconspicua]